jgi:hypothetical protein
MRETNPPSPAIPNAVALACSLPEDALRERMAGVRGLLSRATERRPLDDGALLRFSGDDEAARLLLDFVLFERRCCSALAFELVFEPPHDAVALRVRGGGEGVALARALAGIE